MKRGAPSNTCCHTCFAAGQLLSQHPDLAHTPLGHAPTGEQRAAAKAGTQGSEGSGGGSGSRQQPRHTGG
jgi:hypothetical protein